MGANALWSDSIVFNDKGIASVITALMLTLGINVPKGYHGLGVSMGIVIFMQLMGRHF